MSRAKNRRTNGEISAVESPPFPFLQCCDCGNEMKESDLVSGSPDPDDKRCPECGSGEFFCGQCGRRVDGMRCILGRVTWNCFDGCNP